MKITFLGVSGALSNGYCSNILIENNQDCMLFDCGEDIKHSLKDANRSPEEITDIYISHLHFDHCAGLSWLGYYSYFIMKKRINLRVHESMVSDLWSMLRPSMEKLDGKEIITLDEYFNLRPFKDEDRYNGHIVDSLFFKPVKQLHVETPHGNMYSYGAIFQYSTLDGRYWRAQPNGEEKIFISSDTKELKIPNTSNWSHEIKYDYDYIFCDCDVMNSDGIHPNYNNLKDLDSKIKKRMWLYHYTDLGNKMPDAVADGFAGFAKKGNIFEI